MNSESNKKQTYKTRLLQERVDHETGEIIRQTVESEVIPGFQDVKLRKKRYINNGDFITLFQNTIFRIATEANLSRGEYKLFLYLLGTAGFDNSVVVDYDILCTDLDEKKQNIFKHLKGLTERNIIIRKDGYRGGNQRTLPMELRVNYDQINYGLAWKGKNEAHSQVKYNHPEIIPLIEAKTNEIQLDLFNTESEDISKF